VKPAPFRYVVARSAEEAVAFLAEHDGDARLLAGGQSLVPMLNMRLARPAAVVDLNRIPDLDGISVVDGEVRVGALVRYATLEWAPVVAARLPLLAEAVRFVGDRQVRSRGTLGGSLAQADPSGEMPLACQVLGAMVIVLGPGGTREVPATELFLGPYTAALEPVEMIVEVRFPDSSDSVGVLVEHVRRHGDFAVIAVAALGRPGPGGTWDRVRIGLSGVGPHAFVAEEASATLNGSTLDGSAIEAAGRACLEAADPSTDVRASAEYRRHLVPIYVERALAAVRSRRAGRAA